MTTTITTRTTIKKELGDYRRAVLAIERYQGRPSAALSIFHGDLRAVKVVATATGLAVVTPPSPTLDGPTYVATAADWAGLGVLAEPEFRDAVDDVILELLGICERGAGR